MTKLIQSAGALKNTVSRNLPTLLKMLAGGISPTVVGSIAGPTYRGLISRVFRDSPATVLPVAHVAHLDWQYALGNPKSKMNGLHAKALAGQWSLDSLPWETSVDPESTEVLLLPADFHPASQSKVWRKMTEKERLQQNHKLLRWILSQLLHGEQGAFVVAGLVSQAVPWFDAKMVGSTQVFDEARHVEGVLRYAGKLGPLYQIDDNLYTLIDILLSVPEWDLKFVGMQILIEGLALGAFQTARSVTQEPLLKLLLKAILTDEARHVGYGVLALERCYKELSESELRYREEWTLLMCLLLQQRFMLRELYDENFAAHMSWAAWEKLVFDSGMMKSFRNSMFKSIIPNLTRIGIMSERVQPHYEKLGVLQFKQEKDALTLIDENQSES